MSVEDELAALRAEVAELRGIAREGQAIIALSNLQRSYGYYVDKGLWDEAADLFAPDGTLEIAGRGVYKGRERVRAYLHKLPAYRDGILFNHMQLQPVIHVDCVAGTAQARWGEAIYENAYICADGVWMIAKLHGMITYYADYDRGWNKGGVPLLRRLDGLEPDEPSSIDYEAFPKAFIPPFHYPNPVSGKPWTPE